MEQANYGQYGNGRTLGYRNGGVPHDRRPSNETTLKSDKLQIERKTFLLTVKENPRGRFLRITEDVGGRRDSIIIPASGLEDFARIFAEMAKAAGDTPAPPAE